MLNRKDHPVKQWLGRYWRSLARRPRRGSIIILMAFSIGMAASMAAYQFWSDSYDKYSAAKVSATGYRARLLARAGFQSAVVVLRTAPEDYLFSTGMALSPPDIKVADCTPICFITYRIQPEDGKLNINNLVRSFDDEPNQQYKAIFERYFTANRIPLDIIDATVDWIDKNTYREGRGAEFEYYSSLPVPRKIKNGPMYSLSELAMVKGMTYEMLNASRAPEDWAENQKELAFLTEDEKNLITEDDWLLKNNLTAYIQTPETGDDRVNINAARYHVMMSLSDSITREAVLALFKLRRENGNYLKDITALKTLPEFQRMTPQGGTLYDELVGSGGQTGLIKTEGRFYRIVGVGSILLHEDDINSAVVRRVIGLYDKTLKRLLYYTEE